MIQDVDMQEVTSVETSDLNYSFILKSIQLENFKSYHGSYEICPFPETDALVCVIGPNGSGKSNIMDAVAFCFNVADSAKLRGDGNLCNLICKELDSSEPSPVASVTVGLASRDASIADITFSRSVNSRNESRYKLNGRTVTLEKYRSEMVTCGLDVKGNFLVFQGDVEALALSSPKDLGEIVDRVSGSGAYRKEYESLKLEKSNLESCLAVENNLRKKLLQDKKRIANETVELAKLKSLKSLKLEEQTMFALTRLFVLNSKIQHLVAKSGASSSSGSVRDKLESLKSARARAELHLAKASRKLVADSAAMAELVLLIDEKREKISASSAPPNDLLADSIEALSRKAIQIDAKLGSVRVEIEQEEKKLENLKNSSPIDDWEGTFQIFFQQHGICLEEARLTVDRLRRVQIPLGTLETVAALELAERELFAAKSKMSIFESRAAEIAAQLERNSFLEQAAAARVLEARRKQEVLLTEKEEAEKEREKQEKNLKKNSAKVDRLKTERSRLVEKLSQYRENEEETDYERFLSETFFQLTSNFGREKVLGRVSDFLKPKNPKHLLALQTAAGKYLDAIFVTDISAASECVRWLKMEKKGSLVFIPVKDLRKNSFENHSSALDLLQEVPSEVRAGLEFVLGSTIVCETLAEARHLVFVECQPKLRVVTVGGEKIGHGTITVGGTARAVKNLNLNETRAQLEAIEAELVALESTMGENLEIAEKIRGIEARLANLNLENLKSEWDRLSTSVQTLGEFLATNRAECDGLQMEEKKQAVANLIDLKMKKSLEIAANSVPSGASEQLLAALAETSSVAAGEELVRETIAQLEKGLASLEYEQRVVELDLKEGRENLDLQRSEAVQVEKRVKVWTKELEKMETEKVNLNAKLIELKDEISKETKLKSDAETEIKLALSNLSALKGENEDKKISISKQIEVLQNESVSVLKQAVIDHVRIPLKMTELDEQRDEATVSREILEALFMNLSSDDDMAELVKEVLDRVDFSQLKSVAMSKIDDFLATAEIRFYERVKELDFEISNIVVAHSSDAGVEEGLEKTALEIDKLKTRLATVSEHFSKILQLRNEKFKTCFNFINQKVNTLYQLLSDVSSCASLDLESLGISEIFSSGIIFNLMPPFKRYTNIELLSGGEKTVAALALLFSLLAFSNPPFSIVDEIDAALDAENVQVLARFMKNAVSHQLIVISLKEKMYAQADCLIGVYKDPHTRSSALVTMDLREFAKDDGRSEIRGPQMTPRAMISGG